MSGKSFSFFVIGLTLIAIVVVVGINRSWFETTPQIEDAKIARRGSGDAEPHTETTSRPKKLSQVLGIKDDAVTEIGGVERPITDTNFKRPEAVDFGSKNPVPQPDFPARIAVDSGPTSKLLASDLTNAETQRKVASAYSVIDEFDVVSYKENPKAYLALVRPNRVRQTSSPGENVTPIKAESPRFVQVLDGEKVLLRVRGMPQMPVTFHTNQTGAFKNRFKTMTLAFDADGIAEAEFEPGNPGMSVVNVLVGSPVHSGQLKFVIRVVSDTNS